MIDAATGIARILKQEGVEWVSTFPVCKVNNALGREGIPMVMMRDDRYAIAVADAYDGKGSIVVGVTPDLVKRFSAVDLVRIGVAELGGKGGGGRPDMAQGGGPDAGQTDAALAAIERTLKDQLAV